MSAFQRRDFWVDDHEKPRRVISYLLNAMARSFEDECCPSVRIPGKHSATIIILSRQFVNMMYGCEKSHDDGCFMSSQFSRNGTERWKQTTSAISSKSRRLYQSHDNAGSKLFFLVNMSSLSWFPAIKLMLYQRSHGGEAVQSDHDLLA